MKRVKFIMAGAALTGIALLASACGDARAVNKNLVTEVVVYRVKAKKLGTFPVLSRHIHSEVRRFPGFVSIKTSRSPERPGEFMDIVQWKSKKQALAAFKNFPTLPHAAEFMAALDGKPLYAGHFQSMGD